MAPIARVAECHPERRHHAKGMCSSCYTMHLNALRFSKTELAERRRRYRNKGSTVFATCHPDKEHFAKGLCVGCYHLQRYHSMSPEEKQKHHSYGKSWIERNQSRDRFIKMKSKIKRLYNMSEWDIEVLYLIQGGSCFGCGRAQEDEESRLQVDHNHLCCSGVTSCGKCIRGLLCGRCNKILGHANDSAETLQALADYVSSC